MKLLSKKKKKYPGRRGTAGSVALPAERPRQRQPGSLASRPSFGEPQLRRRGGPCAVSGYFDQFQNQPGSQRGPCVACTANAQGRFPAEAAVAGHGHAIQEGTDQESGSTIRAPLQWCQCSKLSRLT